MCIWRARPRGKVSNGVDVHAGYGMQGGTWGSCYNCVAVKRVKIQLCFCGVPAFVPKACTMRPKLSWGSLSRSRACHGACFKLPICHTTLLMLSVTSTAVSVWCCPSGTEYTIRYDTIKPTVASGQCARMCARLNERRTQGARRHNTHTATYTQGVSTVRARAAVQAHSCMHYCTLT